MGILFSTAQNAARDGLLSTREVGQLISKALEDGTVTAGETEDLKKIRSELYNELTPEARRAISNFLSLGSSFSTDLAANIFGISDEAIDGLERADVRSAQELLIQSRTPEDRQRIAGLASLDEVLVTALAEKVDLSRVLGIGPKYAAVLQGVGINDVQELAGQNAVALRRQITSYLNTTDGRAITTRRPSLDSVKGWIESAKALPRMLRRLGDGGADFDKAAFDALSNTEKSLFLWGNDVRVNTGFVFNAADVQVSGVSQPSGKIKDAIETITSGAFDGDYESAELSYLEEVKVGDEVIGYRASFDVIGDFGVFYEGVQVPSNGGAGNTSEGTVDVAFDANGAVLSRDEQVG